MATKNNPGAFDCYEHAAPDEPMFVLLARDSCAAELVRMWATMRENKLRASDVACTPGEVLTELDQIADARRVADAMENYRAVRNPAESVRYGALVSCGCWHDAPAGVGVGNTISCPVHGFQQYTTMNVPWPPWAGEDDGREWIRDWKANPR